MKILIADDHALFRDGLKLTLERLDANAQVVQAESYEAAEKQLEIKPHPNLIIVDLDMPDKSWQEGLNILMTKAPQAHFVVVSATEDAKTVRQVMEKGVSGYITKRSDSKIITAALKLILEGGTYLPPVLLNEIKPNLPTTSPDKKGKLTARQAEVLKYISQGLSNKQIAYEMGVSEATIKLHINAMLKALNATNRTQALVNAQKDGLI